MASVTYASFITFMASVTYANYGKSRSSSFRCLNTFAFPMCPKIRVRRLKFSFAMVKSLPNDEIWGMAYFEQFLQIY